LWVWCRHLARLFPASSRNLLKLIPPSRVRLTSRHIAIFIRSAYETDPAACVVDPIITMWVWWRHLWGWCNDFVKFISSSFVGSHNLMRKLLASMILISAPCEPEIDW
jgi:hypothetical protein